jgi:hypothetical protein
MTTRPSTEHREIKRFYFFDDDMTCQRVEQEWTGELRKTVRFEIEPGCSLTLFLKYNQWKHYEPIGHWGWCSHSAGFVYNYCIVCGKVNKAFETVVSCEGSPIDCRDPKCAAKVHSLQFTDEVSRELFLAIWTRNFDDLQQKYSRIFR